MYEGNWKCSSCGGAITQLPFQPRSESGLTCRACFAKNKEAEKTEQAAPEMAGTSEEMSTDGVPDFDESHFAGEPAPDESGFEGLDTVAPASKEKAKVAGEWTCSVCGGAITSLPFTPRSTNNLKCLECFKKG